MKISGKTLFTLLFSTAVMTGTARSALLVYEGFDYTAGEALHTKSGGSGWGVNTWNEQNGGSNYQTADSTPLTFPGLVSSDGYAVGGGAYVRVGRALDSSSGSTFDNAGLIEGANINQGSFFVSFLLRRDSDQNVSVGLAVATNVSPQQTNQTGNRFILDINSATDEYSLRYRSDNTGTAANDFSTLATGATNTVGQTDLIVMGIDFGDGNVDASVDLWINPPSIGGAAPSALVSASDVTSGKGGNAYDGSLGSGVTAFNWYPGSGSNHGSLDEIRFATTFAEVTLIPEPGTLGMLLVSMAALLTVYRRFR